MGDVVSWIQKSPKIWLSSKEFGDPDFEEDNHLLLQRSCRGSFKNKGITIQRIGVRKDKRRQGEATKMLDIIEKTAKECGLSFVLIQSVVSDAMVELVNKREGYTQINRYDDQTDLTGDYIKRL